MADASIRLDSAVADRLIEIARASAPAECCGALLGHTDFVSEWKVVQFIELTNRSPNSERAYVITSDDVRFAQRKARHYGIDVVGFFHSHPNGSAAPSASDLERAWPGYVYVIVAGDQIGSFTLDEERGEFRAVDPVK